MIEGSIVEISEAGFIKDRNFGRENTICCGGSDRSGEKQP